MQSLTGSRVLITGAGSGIGRAIAERAAGLGAEILAADLRLDAAEATADAIRRTGRQARGLGVDVTEHDSVAALRARVLDEGGPIDVLVNNAGVVFGGPFLDVPIDRHLATYRVNVEGVVQMTHAFLPDLIGRPSAHLVQIASASGFLGLPFGSTYASSKWAVLGLSESIRMELRQLGHRHVGVTAVCPSYVQTGMFDGARAPGMTRLLTPQRVAALTVSAILRNKPYVLAPWLVHVSPLLNAVLPRPVLDAVAGLFGVTTSMADWRGHGAPGGSGPERG